MGFLGDAVQGKIRDIDNAIDQGISYGAKFAGIGEDFKKNYEKFQQDWGRAWTYDDREPISGEAKAVNPLQFMQFTPWRFVGVTRAPQLAAKIGTGAYKVGKTLSKVKVPNVSTTWKKSITKNLQKQSKKLGAGAGAAVATQIPRLLSKTGKMSGKVGKSILKDPKKTGALAGTGLMMLNRSGTHRSQEDSEPETSFITRRRVNRKTWLA